MEMHTDFVVHGGVEVGDGMYRGADDRQRSSPVRLSCPTTSAQITWETCCCGRWPQSELDTVGFTRPVHGAVDHGDGLDDIIVGLEGAGGR